MREHVLGLALQSGKTVTYLIKILNFHLAKVCGERAKSKFATAASQMEGLLKLRRLVADSLRKDDKNHLSKLLRQSWARFDSKWRKYK